MIALCSKRVGFGMNGGRKEERGLGIMETAHSAGADAMEWRVEGGKR
jgi:hypothetical protein